METLQARVADLLAKRGLSQAEAARRGGFRNSAFINDIMRGHKQSVRGDNLVQLAQALDTTEAYLLLQTDDPSAPRSTVAAPAEYRDAPHAPVIDRGAYPRDVPVRGIAVGGEDADFAVNGETGDFVRRPPGLEGKRGVYALHVNGESMWPAHRHGALVYVDSNRLPGAGDDAVIELHPEEPQTGEPGRGYLKRVKRIGPSRIVVEQFNPARDIEFERADIKSFHRVIPWEEVLGY